MDTGPGPAYQLCDPGQVLRPLRASVSSRVQWQSLRGLLYKYFTQGLAPSSLLSVS